MRQWVEVVRNGGAGGVARRALACSSSKTKTTAVYITAHLDHFVDLVNALWCPFAHHFDDDIALDKGGCDV